MQFLSLKSLFTIQTGEYRNFSFSAEAADSVRNIILALCCGIVLATLVTLYQRNVPGAFIRALLRAEAFSPEKAITLEESGFSKRFFIKWELCHGALMRRTVVRLSDDCAGSDGKPNFLRDRFYIPEKDRYRAEIRYQNKGNGPLPCLITVFLTVVLSVLLIRLFPLLLSLIDTLL